MPGRLLIVRGFLEGRTYNIPNGGTLSIGRGPQNTLQVLEQTLSRRHCEITVKKDGQATLRDLGSSYGTRLNDEPVQEHDLSDGDRIALGQGSVALEFYFVGPAAEEPGESTKDLMRASTDEIDIGPIQLAESDDDLEELVTVAGADGVADPNEKSPEGRGPKSRVQGPESKDSGLDADDDLMGPSLGLATTGGSDPWMGRTVAGYEIKERLGEGSLGVVYRAVHPTMDRTVALKLLQINLGAGPEALERFLQAARVNGRFTHPNIIALHDAGQVHGCYYLIREYVDGATLGDRINASGPLPIEECVRIAVQLTEALEMIHGAGVMHYDIKPDNILLTHEGQAKLADLGLVKEMRRSGVLHASSGLMGGLAPHYMSPEQIRDPDLVDHRTDLYALGATLYKMLTGRAPFSADSTTKLFDAIIEETPTPVTELRAETPPALARAVHKLLEKDPANRYASAAQLREDLVAGS